MSDNLLKGVVKAIYDNALRPFLPRKLGMYNGVAVPEPRLFDETILHQRYEESLVHAVRRTVTRADTVCIVGGGRGVSTTVAARRAEQVVVFEASAERIALIDEVIEINNVEENVETRHALVETEIAVDGDTGSASTVTADSLPPCDVLVLDCEGAEREILEELPHDPRSIIVETHGVYGAPTDEVAAQLAERGYEVVNQAPELAENDIFILTAVAADAHGTGTSDDA